MYDAFLLVTILFFYVLGATEELGYLFARRAAYDGGSLHKHRPNLCFARGKALQLVTKRGVIRAVADGGNDGLDLFLDFGKRGASVGDLRGLLKLLGHDHIKQLIHIGVGERHKVGDHIDYGIFDDRRAQARHIAILLPISFAAHVVRIEILGATARIRFSDVRGPALSAVENAGKKIDHLGAVASVSARIV